MPKHINIKNDNYTFKFRVSGVIIKENKILLVNMDDADFFCLPGGHVELGETTEEAMVREMTEELTIKTHIKKYLGTIENFFINKHNVSIHEIAVYYLMDFEDENTPLDDIERIENDHGTNVKLKFKWFNLDELDNLNIQPQYLKEILKGDLEFKHFIIKH